MTGNELAKAMQNGKRIISNRELGSMCQLRESTIEQMLRGTRPVSNAVIACLVMGGRWPLNDNA